MDADEDERTSITTLCERTDSVVRELCEELDSVSARPSSDEARR
jgi:hypothetical protein